MHAYNKSFWCLYVVCTHSSIFVVPSFFGTASVIEYDSVDILLKISRKNTSFWGAAGSIDFSTMSDPSRAYLFRSMTNLGWYVVPGVKRQQQHV